MKGPMDAIHNSTFSFSDGALHIDVPLAKARLRWRPEPKAEELKVGLRRWREFWPDYRLIYPVDSSQNVPDHVVEIPESSVSPDGAKQKYAALGQFRTEVEEEIVRIVEPFGSYQWALMVLVRNEPWAKDLAVGNPTLAYALANSHLLRGSSPEAAAVQARWYCHKKQRDLLEWLGFPGTEPVARLLRKIPPGAVSPSVLHRLKYVLKAEPRTVKLLAPLPTINGAILELATIPKYLDLLTPSLLREMAAKPPKVSVADRIHSGLVVLEQIAAHRAPKPFANLKQVLRFREDAEKEIQAFLLHREQARQEEARRAEQERLRRWEEARLRSKREAELRRLPFPPPPLHGTPDILPLTSKELLEMEGREQNNCAAEHDMFVRRGGYYVYQVLAPERATLSIYRGRDRRWRRLELRVKNNKNAKPSTEKAVDRWLEQAREIT